MALADPDLPLGIVLPELRVEPPLALDADRYSGMREAFYGLPRRSRVVVVLRLPLSSRRPLTLDAIGRLFGIGPERVRQLEHHAAWMLLRALRSSASPSESTRDERMAELAPIIAAAVDRYPLDNDPGGRAPRPGALRAIAPLVEAGLVQRGQTTTCPQCNYTAFERLGALNETITCRACREQYVLPALDSSGRREPATTYQLDGLTARVMDQDLVPVLLALRALRNQAGASDRFFAWPGVELRNGSETSEVDLLVSTGKEVWLGEVKSNCANLQPEQLEGLLSLATELGAKPLVAGLDGEFSASIASAVEQAGGRVLDRSKLFV